MSDETLSNAMDKPTDESTDEISKKPIDNEYAMYIFINNDLKMDKGKIASQVGHAVQFVIEDIYMNSGHKSETFDKYKKWRTSGCAKLVLKASTAQMNNLKLLPGASSIVDEGRTQIAPNSLTVVAFCPELKKNMRDITSSYKLL